MKANNYYHKMTEIYRRLQDEESRILFENRIAYLINRNRDEYIEAVCELYDDWNSQELCQARQKEEPIIVFGCGHDGKMTNKLLSAWGYDVSYFCDNYKYGEIIDGKKVVSIDEVVEKYKESIVVIGSSKYGKEMYIELIQKGFPYKNIVLPKYKMAIATRGMQYFDVFEPYPEEVYVDAGTFDGETLLDFRRWANGNYKKIYALEPMQDMYEVICRKVEKENIERIKVLNNAAWNQKEKLHFAEHGAGSHMDCDGKSVVEGVDIDSVVNDEKVTFIKMDIEGAELNALKGARNTIRKNHPRLAVCIYHKPLDIVEIASYILDLVPEYKFYIRHYASNMWETVLYAIV